MKCRSFLLQSVQRYAPYPTQVVIAKGSRKVRKRLRRRLQGKMKSKSTSAEAAMAREVEANRFAMELLMPEPLVQRRLFELLDEGIFIDDAAEKMAKEFRVSVFRMSVQIYLCKLQRKYWEKKHDDERRVRRQSSEVHGSDSGDP